MAWGAWIRNLGSSRLDCSCCSWLGCNKSSRSTEKHRNQRRDEALDWPVTQNRSPILCTSPVPSTSCPSKRSRWDGKKACQGDVQQQAGRHTHPCQREGDEIKHRPECILR